MQRKLLFIIVVLATILTVVASIATFYPQQTSMSDMMGGGMGAMHTGMSFFWPTILTISTSVAIVLVAYVILFPNIKYAPTPEKTQEIASKTTEMTPMEIAMRVSKADERAVLEVLRASGGVCYQKDITYKTGFSKIKTHRIVARLAERGLIQVRKAGKTNEIRIPSWLKKPEPASS